MGKTRVNLVSEAERIVSEYSSRNHKKKQDAEFDVLLNAVMTLSCVMLAVVLAMGLLYAV